MKPLSWMVPVPYRLLSRIEQFSGMQWVSVEQRTEKSGGMFWRTLQRFFVKPDDGPEDIAMMIVVAAACHDGENGKCRARIDLGDVGRKAFSFVFQEWDVRDRPEDCSDVRWRDEIHRARQERALTRLFEEALATETMRFSDSEYPGIVVGAAVLAAVRQEYPRLCLAVKEMSMGRENMSWELDND